LRRRSGEDWILSPKEAIMNLRSLRNSLFIAFTVAAAFYVAAETHKAGKAESREPQDVVGQKYSRSYFPNTEKLGANEMRITALGTGMPTVATNNAAASFLVELGNGDSFLLPAR
jgi:ribonuclease Z